MGQGTRPGSRASLAVLALITIGSFIIVLAVLVLAHELGHFLTAKAFGIKVLEFGFGYPPRLLAFRKGETTYSLNLLPLGGFVKLLGEEDPTAPRSLAGKGVGTRFIVLSAGALMNVLLPLVLFSALFMVPQKTFVGQVVVREVVQDSPAAQAGVLPGDVILKADGRTVEGNGDLAYIVHLNLGANMEWLLQRGDSVVRTSLVPRFNPPAGQGATGVRIETTNVHEEKRAYAPWRAVPMAAQRIADILVLAKNEAVSWIVVRNAPQVAGPIGIAQMTGQVAQAGIVPLIEFTALLSINLAILNILPIPMLDGGRLLFVAIEWVRRGKRIPPEKEGFVHLVGFVVLIALIVFVSYFDLVRVFQGESLLR